MSIGIDEQLAQDATSNNTLVEIADGNDSGTKAFVKAASTAAVATDQALVVAVSPNNTVGVTQSTSPWVDNITQFGGTNISTGTGASGTGIPRVTVSDDSNVLVTQSTSPWITKDQSDGPVTPGTVASFSQLTGGQYNTTLPTLTNTEQSATQLDSSGRIIVSPLTNTSVVKAQLQDNSGNGITSTTVGSNQALDVDIVQAVTDTDITTSGTIAASGAAVTISINGCSSLNISITGTWTATLQFQGQAGDGTFYSIAASPNTGGQCVTDTTTNGLWAFGCGGFTQVRVECSAYTSGTADIRITASAGDNQTLATDSANNQQVVGNIASGTIDSGNGVKISGIYNTTVPAFTNGQRGDIQVDSRGATQITPLDGLRQTYSTSAIFAPASSATDIFTIAGSSTKTIRILRIEISGAQNSPDNEAIRLIKRSSANTGGTSTTETAVPHDSNNNAATATVLSYTVNPTTLGTQVGIIRSSILFMTALTGSGGANGVNDLLIYEFGNRPGQSIVLRGTAQVLAVNFDSQTAAGNEMYISIEWSEE